MTFVKRFMLISDSCFVLLLGLHGRSVHAECAQIGNATTRVFKCHPGCQAGQIGQLGDTANTNHTMHGGMATQNFGFAVAGQSLQAVPELFAKR